MDGGEEQVTNLGQRSEVSRSVLNMDTCREREKERERERERERQSHRRRGVG